MPMHPRYPRDVLAERLQRGDLAFDAQRSRILTALADTVFFASLAVEEGAPVRVAIAYHEHGAAGLASVVEADAAVATKEPQVAWEIGRAHV